MRKLMTAAAAAALIALAGCGEEAAENDANEELGQTTEEVEDAVNESAPAGVDSDETGDNLDGPNAEIETGAFRTAHADGLHGLRFGVSGDWRGELRPYVSIANLPERDLDFFIEGDGFFQVDIAEDRGDGIGYTRAGNFFQNRDGEMVLGNSNGPRLIPPISIPDDAIDIEVSQDGRVQVLLPDQVEFTEVGQLEFATFVNKAGLSHIGGNLFVETVASGPPITGEPAQGQFGGIMQGFLENSNVDPVEELVSLIRTQRAFELNSQTVQAADEALQQISNLRRF